MVEESRLGGLDLCVWGKFCKRHGVVYPLLFHMLDVAALAGELWDRMLVAAQRARIASGLGLSEDEARGVLMFIAGLHDLGKASRFQACEPLPWARVGDALRADTRGWRLVRHERASLHALVGILAEMGYPLEGDASPAVRMAQVAGGHHGRFLQVDVHGAASAARVRADLGGLLWQQLRFRYAAQVRHLTGAQAVPARVSVTAAVLMTGVVMVADRLASQRRVWRPRTDLLAYGTGEHFTWACWMARQTVEQSQLARFRLPPRPFAAVHGLRGPNALQASVLDQLPAAAGARGAGIMLVADGTGAGKTVSALEAARILNQASGTEGVCWLLPTTATADAAYDTLYAYVAAHRPFPAALTLVHNHSYLNAAYSDQLLAPGDAASCTGDDPHLDEDDEDGWLAGDHEDADGQGRRWLPDGWLRGWDRALLAILARLLHWLGALRTPVVVLSATLPGQVARELVYAYLTGSGHRRRELLARADDFTVPYPGWLFADAATARTTVIDPRARTAHAAAQQRTLTLQQRPVHYRPLEQPGRRIKAGERLARITAALNPVARMGGCAVIACATVADAQDTYRHLQQALDWPGAAADDLVLLHARLPAHRRERTLTRIRTRLGPTGPRPHRLVLVTTSLLELSLNIDADLMVSDLTSLARLIQRAGRLWRFEQAWQHQRPPGIPQRPTWVRARGPRLTVLHPVGLNRTTLLPAAWAATDAPYLQHATAHLLTTPGQHRITLPEHTQHLVELIHQSGEPATWSPCLAALHGEHLAGERGEQHTSSVHLIPPHDRVASLADLHRQPLTAAHAATRPRDRPARVLALYQHPGRPASLDAAGHLPLPQGPYLRPADIRTVLEHTLPVPSAWVAAARRHVPDAWQHHPLLADLVLLPHDPTRPQPVQLGRHQLYLDDELGLIHHEAPHGTP
ncbi:CRISPR-associated endonuclease Cas3'' [Streptomyces canus]|uniref:CRISPR-associated endonuclease Cas3'' n=1 Tax=Streptomyces canus TaxID=58343 RepID=UPI002E30C933|nr:CRISPR-associated endonuclease Cas3'' [Streptomyces canus]